MLTEMRTAPVDQPVSKPMQAILVAGSYAIWLGLLIYAAILGKKEKTYFYAFVIFAVGVGGIFEPLYDESLMLYFYRPGMWKLYTSFDIPQPVWVYSGYVTLYASVAVFLTRDIHHGITRKQFFKYAIVELLSSCAFEMIAINGGVYEYWGPHVFRIFEYPICIGILEMTQVMCYSVAAAHLRSRAVGVYPLLGVFVIFPITFMGANLGAGAPLIVSLHSPNPTNVAVTFGSLATIFMALTTVWGVSFFLPVEGQIALDEHDSGPKTNSTRTYEDVEDGSH
ncbi:hypothetical protein K432DRAFT_402341 [Lepidopterella palustris CBS 459.81]|uniref:Uncharacterized protein n=1 Tax=Lepidopterella palustris CBS 459.81 TaxID=1314670 RepID=A0A8E2JHV6_9PEZI|nr:hypothetical protein K432DRAFT_402341 [Lepidopterella palustris CBS 459.81]